MIETVKILKDDNGNDMAYLVDGVKSVPLDDKNRDHEKVQSWIAGGGEVQTP